MAGRPSSLPSRRSCWVQQLFALALACVACGQAEDVFLGGVLGEQASSGGASLGGSASATAGAGGVGSLSCSSASVSDQRLSILEHAAGFGRRAGGGELGCVVTINDPGDSGPGTLRDALESEEELWIRFSVNEIFLSSDIDVRSNKTIDGSGSDVTIRRYGLRIGEGVSNVVVHGVEFRGDEGEENLGGAAGSEESDDAIEISRGAHDVWIDHCSFSSYADGLIDIVAAATDITVSYCHFFDHRKVMLIGTEDGGPEDQQIRVTLHHNWYDRTETYHPRLRRGRVHSYNNYFYDWDDFGSGASEEGEIFSEQNVYEAESDIDATVTQVADDANPGRLASEGDVAINGAVLTERDADLVFDPSDFYQYSPEAAGRELVAIIQSEAGTR